MIPEGQGWTIFVVLVEEKIKYHEVVLYLVSGLDFRCGLHHVSGTVCSRYSILYIQI